jgi:hypothetical protein
MWNQGKSIWMPYLIKQPYYMYVLYYTFSILVDYYQSMPASTRISDRPLCLHDAIIALLDVGLNQLRDRPEKTHHSLTGVVRQIYN